MVPTGPRKRTAESKVWLRTQSTSPGVSAVTPAGHQLVSRDSLAKKTKYSTSYKTNSWTRPAPALPATPAVQAAQSHTLTSTSRAVLAAVGPGPTQTAYKTVQAKPLPPAATRPAQLQQSRTYRYTSERPNKLRRLSSGSQPSAATVSPPQQRPAHSLSYAARLPVQLSKQAAATLSQPQKLPIVRNSLLHTQQSLQQPAKLTISAMQSARQLAASTKASQPQLLRIGTHSLTAAPVARKQLVRSSAAMPSRKAIPPSATATAATAPASLLRRTAQGGATAGQPAVIKPALLLKRGRFSLVRSSPRTLHLQAYAPTLRKAGFSPSLYGFRPPQQSIRPGRHSLPGQRHTWVKPGHSISSLQPVFRPLARPPAPRTHRPPHKHFLRSRAATTWHRMAQSPAGMPVLPASTKRKRPSWKTHLQRRGMKLVRIDGALYCVQGQGRSLQRQPTTADKPPALSPAKAAFKRTSKYALVRSAAAVQAQAAASAITQRAAAQRLLRARATSTAAKRRSMRLVNTHCPAYCRSGRCAGKEKGTCRYIHDPTTVALCLRWVQGSCRNKSCALQHRLCPDLMPICAFFLQGMCSKVDCPYLHVKLDPAAPTCPAFLRGFCPKGASCTKKHLTPQMIKDLNPPRTFVKAQAAADREVPALPAIAASSGQEALDVRQDMAAQGGQTEPILRSISSLDLLRPAFLRMQPAG